MDNKIENLKYICEYCLVTFHYTREMFIDAITLNKTIEKEEDMFVPTSFACSASCERATMSGEVVN